MTEKEKKEKQENPEEQKYLEEKENTVKQDSPEEQRGEENQEVLKEQDSAENQENFPEEGNAENQEVLEERESTEEQKNLKEQENAEEQEEQKKWNMVLGFGIGILLLTVVVLFGCVICAQKINQDLVSKVEKLQDEYKKLQASIPEVTVALEPMTEATETPAPELREAIVPTKPAEDNFEAVEQNLREQQFGQDQQQLGQDQQEGLQNQGADQNPVEGEDNKVITSPENTAEFVTYEHFIEGKKFSFEYPSVWDGKIIFANVTNEDGSVVVTCYQSGQYADHQNGAVDTGEIFHILVNKNPAYQTETNDQYKIAEKDGYCAYYEEPTGVTYDYVNHKEYALDYKMVYESQAKVWRSFQFS